MVLRGLIAAGVVDAAVVATCDADPERAALFAAAHAGARATTDPDEAMDGADAVWIATPTSSHADLVGRAAARGTAVYCEKPLAPTLAQADALASLATERAIAVQVGLVLRHSPVLAAFDHAIHSGDLGRPMAAVLRDDQYFPVGGMYGSTWRAEHAVAGGGTLIEHSIHDVDLLAWLLGPIVDVAARSRNFSRHPGIEDVLVATLGHDGGATSALASIWHGVVSRPSTRRIEVLCEKGVLWTEDEHVGPLWLQTDDGTIALPCAPDRAHAEILERAFDALDMPQEWRGSLTSYVLSDLSFLDALRCGEPPFPDLATALEAHRVVAAAYGDAARRDTRA